MSKQFTKYYKSVTLFTCVELSHDFVFLKGIIKVK